METPSPTRTGRWDAVVVLLRCPVCKTTTERPIWDAAKTLNLCCKTPMVFKGHKQPCSCPSCS